MKKLFRVLLAGSMAVSSLAVVLGVSVGSVEARTFQADKYFNRDKCYKARRVPAIVEVNTRGRLLRKSTRSWIGNAQRHGAKVVNKYHDPVFITTNRIVEDQHVTLVPTKC